MPAAAERFFGARESSFISSSQQQWKSVDLCGRRFRGCFSEKREGNQADHAEPDVGGLRGVVPIGVPDQPELACVIRGRPEQHPGIENLNSERGPSVLLRMSQPRRHLRESLDPDRPASAGNTVRLRELLQIGLGRLAVYGVASTFDEEPEADGIAGLDLCPCCLETY